MNYIYVDPTATASGNGSLASPYKTVSDFIAAGVTHPFTLYIKRGTTLVDTANFGTQLKNESGVNSVITAYGVGSRPHWINRENRSASISGSHIRGDQVRGLTISEIDFYCKNNKTWQSAAQTIITLNLPNSYSTDIDAEVWVRDCAFYGETFSSTGRYTYFNSAINMYVMSGATKRVNKFGVLDCDFVNIARPIQLIGNHAAADDITDNSKGTYYSQGVRVENCSMSNIVKGGVEVGGVESRNGARVEDEYQSIIKNCTYSSYNWDQGDASGNIYADACFWTYRCNRVMWSRIKCDGATPLAADNEVIDFDMMTWDCVAQFIVGGNNGASLLLISKDSGARTPYAGYSSTYTKDQWYYDRRNGSGNNIVEYSVFTNSGVNSGYPTGYENAVDIRTSGFIYGNEIRNCVFLDNASYYAKPLIGNGAEARSNGIPPVIVSNCVMLLRHCIGTTITMPRGITNIVAPDSYNNCIFWSLAWAASDATAALAALSAVATVSAVSMVDPLLSFMPTQSLPSLAAAKRLTLSQDSPARGTGLTTTTPDINGKTGNHIWWMQL